jgi:DNA-binding MarR family transcriptional regulator
MINDMPPPTPGGPGSASAASRELEAVRALARIARLLERASGELSLAHYRVLTAIEAGDERASRVAARLALGKPTISAAVDALGRRGLITRADVEGDQRATALRLTAAGRAVLASAEEAMLAQVGDLVARTPEGARVYESLAWLGAALDEAAEARLAARRGTRP